MHFIVTAELKLDLNLSKKYTAYEVAKLSSKQTQDILHRNKEVEECQPETLKQRNVEFSQDHDRLSRKQEIVPND